MAAMGKISNIFKKDLLLSFQLVTNLNFNLDLHEGT